MKIQIPPTSPALRLGATIAAIALLPSLALADAIPFDYDDYDRTWDDNLRPIPGAFNDMGIATGSICRREEDGKWIMVFTSKG